MVNQGMKMFTISMQALGVYELLQNQRETEANRSRLKTIIDAYKQIIKGLRSKEVREKAKVIDHWNYVKVIPGIDIRKGADNTPAINQLERAVMALSKITEGQQPSPEDFQFTKGYIKKIEYNAEKMWEGNHFFYII